MKLWRRVVDRRRKVEFDVDRIADIFVRKIPLF